MNQPGTNNEPVMHHHEPIFKHECTDIDPPLSPRREAAVVPSLISDPKIRAERRPASRHKAPSPPKCDCRCFLFRGSQAHALGHPCRVFFRFVVIIVPWYCTMGWTLRLRAPTVQSSPPQELPAAHGGAHPAHAHPPHRLRARPGALPIRLGEQLAWPSHLHALRKRRRGLNDIALQASHRFISWPKIALGLPLSERY